MFTRKRLCPYQNHSSGTDQFGQEQSQKKPCLDHGGRAAGFAPEDSMEWEAAASLHTNTYTQVSNRLSGDCDKEENKFSGFSNTASVLNNNNNNNTCDSSNNSSDMYITPTDVCHRCQAGESGHYGHIGR